MALWFFLFVLEVSQLVIRPTVLAMRLCINMFAGHSVLLVFACLGFIIMSTDVTAVGSGLALGIAGWVLTVILYFLELLVAVLQAFIFTMLSAVFIGLCAHPEH
jgi:F-type H+-transporting ATPase subunit a